MTEMLKIIGVAFVTSITAILLKSTKPELSFAVTITGILVILLFLLDAIKGTLTAFNTLAEKTGIDNGLIRLLLKIVGVGYLTEFGAGIVNDFGCSSLADKIVLGGKLTIVALSLPILYSLLGMVNGFLALI